MSRRTQVCAAAGHPAREHPACSGCGCHCHPGKPLPPDFRQRVQHWRDKTRAQQPPEETRTDDDPDHEQP